MLFQESLLHSPSRPLAHSLWCTSGSGHQLGMEKRSGSCVMWRDPTVLHYIFPIYRSLMKEFIAALSATKLEARFLNQQGLALVRVHTSITIIWTITAAFCFLFLLTADPPRVTTHPKELKDAVPGQSVTFTVHATGKEPISYQWQWKPSGDELDGSEEWLLCDMEWSHGTALNIPSVHKSNEGLTVCMLWNTQLLWLL